MEVYVQGGMQGMLARVSEQSSYMIPFLHPAVTRTKARQR